MSRTREDAVGALVEWDAANSTPPWGRDECARAVSSVLDRYGAALGEKLDAPPDAAAGARILDAADREQVFSSLRITHKPTAEGPRANRHARNVELALAHLCGDRLEYDRRANRILLDGAGGLDPVRWTG